MQEANTIETRTAATNPGGLAGLYNFLGNLTNQAAAVYQAKLAADSMTNRATGTELTGVASDARPGAAEAAAAYRAAAWAIPVAIGLAILAAFALLRRR